MTNSVILWMHYESLETYGAVQEGLETLQAQCTDARRPRKGIAAIEAEWEGGREASPPFPYWQLQRATWSVMSRSISCSSGLTRKRTSLNSSVSEAIPNCLGENRFLRFKAVCSQCFPRVVRVLYRLIFPLSLCAIKLVFVVVWLQYVFSGQSLLLLCAIKLVLC